MSLAGQGGALGHVRFTMREKALAIGDDFWVEDDHGEKVFKIDGKAMRIRDTFAIKDRTGQEVMRLKEHRLGRNRMVIERDGNHVATVKKGLWRLFRPRYVVRVENGHDLKVRGRVLDHEYKIKRDGDKVAEVSKRWLRVRDTYSIDVEAGMDPLLVIATAVCLDQMAHDVV